MLEEVYFRYVGEHSWRQGLLGESRVDRTQSHVRRRGGAWERGERGTRRSSQETQSYKENQ